MNSSCRKARLRLADLCANRWLFQACLRISFPFRVTRTRSAIPLRVLSLGTLRILLGRSPRTGSDCAGWWCWLVQGREDHEEVAAFHDRLALDDRDVLRRVG